MLKNKIKGLVVLLLIMMIMSITGKSRAADYSCKVSLLGNKTEIKKGETVTLLVKASEIQAGEGIAAFNAMLEYDSDAFECTVSSDDDENWQKQGLVENSLSMTRSDLVANSSDQTIAKIVLKAKSNATTGKKTFKLTKMEFSTGNDTFSVADVSTSITIVDDTGSGTGNSNQNTNNTNTNTNTSGNISNGAGNGLTNNGSTGSINNGNSATDTNIKNTSTITNPSSSSNNIPKTGVTDVLIIGEIIGTIAAIVFYVKYKRAY